LAFELQGSKLRDYNKNSKFTAISGVFGHIQCMQ